MALEACFQVSTITTPTTIKPSLHSFNHKLKLSSKKPSFYSSSFSSSSSSRTLVICQAKNVVDQVVSVTDKTWEETVLKCGNPVLVEFWAPWCGPCKIIAPVIDELAKEYAGKIFCCKINTDESPSIASMYGIRSIPTVLMFKNGERKECIVGAVPKTTLYTTLDKYLEVI